MNYDDVEKLSLVLSNPVSMKYYPHAFSKDEVKKWIAWNIDNYQKNGFGLWGVVLTENEEFIGDCGITMQEIEGAFIPEIGYHIRMEYCKKGYASEAAKACIEYAFNTLKFDRVCSYMKHDNIPSRKVAEKNGMIFQRGFRKDVFNEIVDEVLYMKERGTI
jgi:RimJ/RimL family protein N-acetyltransferase